MGGTAFGRLLRVHRGAAGLTQEELAARAGLSTQAISMLERGGRRAPRAATVECLAGALKLAPAQRSAFAAAAMAWTEPAAPDNGTEDGVLHEGTPGSGGQSPVAFFNKRMPVVVAAIFLGAVTLLVAVGVVLIPRMSHTPVRQSTSAPAPKPYISGLSVTPSNLKLTDSNSYTTIGFHLNVDARVTLTVVDSEGRSVKALVQDVPKKAGPVSRPYYGWNGYARLPPGRYVVRVTATANGVAATAQAPLLLY
jgi:DNA-binding XRE family transcriptional regulator